MKTISSSLLLLLISIQTIAQWDTVVTVDNPIWCLKEFDSTLFVGGNFTEVNGVENLWTFQYDGTKTLYHTTKIAGSGPDNFEVFDNKIYTVGSMQISGTIGVAVWDGSKWINGGGTSYSHGAIYNDKGTLYVVTDNGHIRSRTASTSFTTFLDMNGNGVIAEMIRYKNKLIFAGGFTSIGGVTANNIASWDGQNWSALGDGLDENILCLEVYNDKLYAGGLFHNSGTKKVEGLAVWDGTSWAEVGGGINPDSILNGVYDVISFDEKLWAMGDFTQIEGINVNKVATWNDTIWDDPKFPKTEAVVSTAGTFNNHLYLGTFDYNNDNYVFGIKGVNSPTNVNDFHKTKNNKTITFYPNPNRGVFSVHIEQENNEPITYQLYSVTGEIVYETKNNNSKDLVISNISTGVYILKAASASSYFSSKQIIVH